MGLNPAHIAILSLPLIVIMLVSLILGQLFIFVPLIYFVGVCLAKADVSILLIVFVCVLAFIFPLLLFDQYVGIGNWRLAVSVEPLAFLIGYLTAQKLKV